MARAAVVGVVERGNEAVLVTLGAGGELLDRRAVRLAAEGLPSHPHHHEGSWAVGRYLDSPWARPITLAEAIALVERVQASAGEEAVAVLERLAAQVPEPIGAVALRAFPPLPSSIEARIRDHRVQTWADTAMVRQALADAAAGRGWRVRWYDRERVRAEAEAALDAPLDPVLAALGRQAGPPWRAAEKLAATAALAAG